MTVHGFRRTLGGRIVLRVDDVDRGLLTAVVTQLVDLITPDVDPFAAAPDPLAELVGIEDDAERPDDPALARLFPDAYPDDDDASSEFRRFTQKSLRDLKTQHARTVLDALAAADRSVEVPRDDVQAWLGALNDVRLAVATRLGLTEDNHELFAMLDEDDPAFAIFHLYDWLTFLQETLVQAAFGLRSEPPPGADVG